MNERDIVRKLRAYTAGKPLPHGTTLHLPKRGASETLILAFVRMGGESRPWGIAVGRPDRPPKLFTVPEARDRELVGEMLEEFAPVLLEHMRHPAHRAASETYLPHVWLPNASHVEMLHFLAFTYTFAKRGDPKRLVILNAVGRAANWLFQESTRPGQISCIDASAALREAYAFPAEPVRQAHTAYLLAWLESKGDYESRLAAASEEERHAVSTSLDPQVEKANLDELVEGFNEAKRGGETKRSGEIAKKIRRLLERELKRRFYVAARAWTAFRADRRPVNGGVRTLEQMARERFDKYLTTETKVSEGGKAWVRSPESDRHSLMAASGYIKLEADEGRWLNELVHEDEDLQQDLLLSGDGLRGKILRIIDESVGRSTVAVWVIESDAERPLRVRLGDDVVQAGYPKRAAILRDVTASARGKQTFELRITKGILLGEGPLGRPPLDPSWRGRTVTFLQLPEPGFSFRKLKTLWDRQGPGTWLTHQQPYQGWAAAGEDDHDADAGAAV